MFPNPDAKKKPDSIDMSEAEEILRATIRQNPNKSEVELQRHRKAELLAMFGLLKEMADSEGKVPKYKGGRFEKLEKEVEVKVEGEGLQKRLTDKLLKPTSKEEILAPTYRDTGSKPRDLTTLIINVLTQKFAHEQSLDTRLLMSANGSQIYMAVKADQKDLERTAEETQYSMQLAIGITDLTSMEPCQGRYYPL